MVSESIMNALLSIEKKIEEHDATKSRSSSPPNLGQEKPEKPEKPSKPAHKEKDPEELAPVKPAATANTKEPGFLVANTQPWAKVIIDGKDTGKTTPIAPRSKIALKPGKHVVTFVANGKKFNFDVVIKPAEDTRLIKQLADTQQ